MATEQRDAIVAAAVEMMRRRGYSPVGVTEVCRASDTSRAQFYRLFAAKSDLGVAVIEHFSAERQSLVGRAFVEGMPVRGQIQRMFAMLHAEQVAARAAIGRTPGSVFSFFVDDGDDDPILRAGIQGAYDAWRDAIRDALVAANERHELVLPDPAFPAKALVAFAEGALAQARAADDPAIILDLAPASMSLLIDRRATGAWPLILASSGSYRSV